nr:AAC(3) family N-acetyltransferase [uncultured Pseudodesulfovibrio sp.]
MNVKDLKQFIFTKYCDKLTKLDIHSASELADDFDIIASGLIDSMSFLALQLEFEATLGNGMDLSLAGDGPLSTLETMAFCMGGEKHQHTVTIKEWEEALKNTGITSGDMLVIHSGLQHLGSFENDLDGFLQGIFNVIGSQGTIMVPAGNIPVFKNDAFDKQNTPAIPSLGVFPEFVRTRPGATRNNNPLDGACALGAKAEDLMSGENTYAYADDSPWQKAIDQNAKLLCAGIDLSYASIVHTTEFREKVPYRNTLEFKHTYTDNGLTDTRSYYLYARNPETTHYDFGKLKAYPAIIEDVKKASVGHGTIEVYNTQTVIKTAMAALRQNPEAFLAQ